MSDWYFAYGSNLLMDQMAQRIGPMGQGDDPCRLARLPNYRLVFNVPGNRGHVFANILSPGNGVHGVVYRYSPEALRRLDQYEEGYERQRVEVIMENGDRLEAFAYVAPSTSVVQGRMPSAEYLNRIIRGARQQGLSESYIQEIEAIAAANGE